MNETIEHVTKASAGTVNEIKTIGRTWARYGLNVGKMALETSATTLQKTAVMLGNLAETLGADGHSKTADMASNEQNGPAAAE